MAVSRGAKDILESSTPLDSWFDAVEDVSTGLGMTREAYIDALNRDPREIARRLREYASKLENER